MKEGCTTREKILDVAYDTFYTHGYHATGLSTILTKAGVQKGSLYHFFKSKKELALAVIKERIDARFQAKYSPLLQAERPLQALLDFLSHSENFDLKRGCPLGKLVQELSSTDEDFRAALAKVYESYEGIIEQSLQTAIGQSELSPRDAQKLATFITSLIGGAIQRARLGNDERYFTDTMKVLRECLIDKSGP